MKYAQDKQKSYADLHRRTIVFKVREHIFLKILPIRGVMRFYKSGKLSPKYLRPYTQVSGGSSLSIISTTYFNFSSLRVLCNHVKKVYFSCISQNRIQGSRNFGG